MKTYKSFEMFLEIFDDIETSARLLSVGDIFYYMNGVYITLYKTDEYIDAKRLDERESNITEIPNDTIIYRTFHMDK